MRRSVSLVAGFMGFVVGVTAAFLVLDVWLGQPELAGSKLSVVMALGPAFGAHALADRAWGWMWDRKAEGSMPT